MSHLVSRSWAALLLASTLALSACSTSDTSGIRTRNSSLVDTCITVNPLPKSTVIVADINSTCATAIVDINESTYTRGGRSTGTPIDDQLNPTAQQLSFDHNFTQYIRGFEARNNNTPVEYVQVAGIGGNLASMTLKSSIITEVQASDSCLAPSNNSWGVQTSGCNMMDSVLITVRSIDDGPYTYLSSTESTQLSGSFNPDTQSPSSFYVSALAMRNGFPQQRMTIRLTEAQTFEYRFYSYSEPTTVSPYVYQFIDTNTTTSSPDTTSPVDEVTTTVADTSTTTPDNTTETTTTASPVTTEVTTPSTTGPINVTALSQQFSDDCEQLRGVEVYPAISDWTDSTRFEINISNECMTRSTYSDTDMRYVWHDMIATSKETGRSVHFQLQGDARSRVSFNGRLPVGEWKIDITQYASSALPESVSTIAARSFTSNVTSDPNNQWKWCTKDDIVFDAGQIVVNCDYTSAAIYLANTNEDGQEFVLNPRGVPTAVSVNTSGWVPGGVSFNADGYHTQVNLLLCSTNCGTLPSELDAEVVRTSQGVLITPQTSSCENPLAPIVGLYYLTQVNANFIVHDPIVGDSYIDGALTSGVTSIFPGTTSATHVLMFRESNRQRSECTNTMFSGLQWSVIAIPTTEVTSSSDVQPVAASLPARVDDLELARENTPGAPIVVEQNQTVLEIPASVVSSLTNSGSVSSVAVQTTDGTWRPISGALSTFVPIDESVTDVKVKYTFADGTESVVTKPLISADVYQEALDAGSSSSSPLMVIVIVLALLAIVGGGFTFIRRRA
jgi:hypothetical protein